MWVSIGPGTERHQIIQIRASRVPPGSIGCLARCCGISSCTGQKGAVAADQFCAVLIPLRRRAVRSWRLANLGEHLNAVTPDRAGDLLDRAKREVTLPSFDAAHVGAVDAELVGEGFLAETEGLAVAAQVASEDLLQLTSHVIEPRVVLLEGLHTYE